MMKSFYNKSCGKSSAKDNCLPNNGGTDNNNNCLPSKGRSNNNNCLPCNGKPDTKNPGHCQSSSYQPKGPHHKTPMEECKEKKNYARKCGRPPPDDCYDVKLSMPAPGEVGCSPLKFARAIGPSSGDNNSPMFHLCDNEVISLANTCGEITLSRQRLDDDDGFGYGDGNYERMKNLKKQEALKQKEDKKRGKERFKNCKKNAKQISKKYKDREKLRAANEKDYYKKCLKLEKQKVKAAKQKYKEKKAIAKAKMKANKRKNKQRLKKLNQRLKQRCEEMKARDPNDPKSDSDTGDSMDFEDPLDLMSGSALPCDGELTCFSLTKLSEKPVFGCRTPNQVCVGGKTKPLTAMGMNGMVAPLPKRQVAPCKVR